MKEPVRFTVKALGIRAMYFVLGSLLLTLMPVMPAYADINLGLVTFDASDQGFNSISIDNFTGDPLAGGSALSPDFPSLTAVTFLGTSITVFQGSSTQLFFLGDLGPGIYSPSALEFPASANITSVALTTTLSVSQLSLDGGGSFTGFSEDLSVYLDPSSGSDLSPGDVALIVAAEPLASNP